MTFQQLLYFCTACECESVTRAAEKLFVTQPTVTTAILNLEKEYHLQLFKRREKTIRLTEDGRIFYENAQMLLRHIREFDRAMWDLGQHKRYVQLGIGRSVGASVFSEYYSYGAVQHPQIDFVPCTTLSSAELLEQLRGGRLDVILIPNQKKDDMDDLEKVRLKMTDMVYCMWDDHPLAQYQELEVSMIVGEKMVSTCGDENKMTALRMMFQGAGYDAEPQVVARCEQLNMALSMIRNQVGTGYFPAEGIQWYEGIQKRKIKGDPPIPVYAVWTKEAQKKEEVRIFLKSIKKFYNV